MVILAAICFGFLCGSIVNCLNLIEQFLFNNRLMGILNDDPVLFFRAMEGDTGIQTLRSLSLSQVTQISNILQNFSNHVLIPEDNTVFLIVVRDDATIRFILPRREYTAVIELLIDTHVAHALASPQKNLLYDRGSFRVHNQLILIIRVFQVSVLFPCTDELAIFHFASQGRRYLAGNVLGVVIVDDIGKGYRKLSACFNSFRIKIIIDSNETDAEEWADLFQKFACFNIVTPKSGKVFYYDAVNLFRLNCFHQFLPFRTVKVCTCIAVVNKSPRKMQKWTIANIIIEQSQLIFNGIGLIQIIFTRQTSINGCLVNPCELFLCNCRNRSCLLTAL